MKRLFLGAVVWLTASSMLAQVIPGSPFTGGSGVGVTWPLLAPDGSSLAPSYSFANRPTAGMFVTTGTFVRGPSGSGLNNAGGFIAIDGGPGTGTAAGGGIFFRIAPPSTSGSTLNTVQDAMNISGTDGSITIGLIDILGTPGNMSLQGPRRAAGVTDGAGGTALNLFGSQGTGTGIGGDVRMFVAPPAASTASTQNGNQEVFRASGTTGDITITPGIPGGGTRGTIALSGGATGGKLGLDRTITAGGTTGAQTINKMAGTVNFAAAATTLVVTDSLVSTTSICFAVVRTADATALLKNVVPAAGSFTITLNAAATAETSVGFWCTN